MADVAPSVGIGVIAVPSDRGGTTAAITANARRHLHALDYLRFIAAAMVVCFHYLFNGIVNGKIATLELSPVAPVAKYGFLGVELFFLISGFVIFNSARGKTAREFAVGRAVRLYPTFWAAMTLTAAVLIFLGDKAGLTVGVKQFALNLTMAPTILGVEPVDGVYWTLLYELEFYGLVFLLLLARQGRRLSTYLPFWAFGMLIVTLAAPALSEKAFLGNYFSLFAAGALIAEVRHDSWTVIRGAALAAASFVGLRWITVVLDDYRVQTGATYSTPVALALVIVFYLALLAMCIPWVARMRLPQAPLLGALTYPLYLIHAYIGYVLLSWLASESAKWVWYAFVLAMVLALTYALHWTMELRMRSFWKRAFDSTVGRLVGVVERQTGRQKAVGTAAGR